jgi:hypothetical protein
MGQRLARSPHPGPRPREGAEQAQHPVLKAMALKANELKDFDMVKLVIAQLEMVWDDDAAAAAFYTQLEQAAEQGD